MNSVKFSLMFLAPGMFRLLPPWIIILPMKLIRWEAAGNGLGQGLCRSWGESRKDVAGEGIGAKQQEVAPFGAGGEPGQAGDLKYRAVALGESRFLKAHLPLVSGGEEGEIDWQGLAFLSLQKLGS